MSRLEHPVLQGDLMAYVDGELPASQVPQVADHLLGCPECAAAVAEARQVSGQMAAWQIEEPPVRLADFVLSELRLQSADKGIRGGGRWKRSRGWVYGLGGAFAVVLLLFAVATPSLLRSRQAARGPTLRATLTLPPTAEQGQPSPVEIPTGPMIIRTVKLTIVTKEFDNARSMIDSIVRKSQGYIDRINVKSDAGSARTLSATLRLPVSQMDAGLADLKKLGRLMEESQNSSEITSQYVDLVARLSNARNSEQRLLALLRERAGSLKDVIEMEREIATVREGIERMEAQRKDLNNKVQFATIQLELTEEYKAQLEPPAPSTGTQIRNAFVDGIQSAGENSLDITVFVLRYGPAILVWLMVLAPIVFLLWRVRRGQVDKLPN